MSKISLVAEVELSLISLRRVFDCCDVPICSDRFNFSDTFFDPVKLIASRATTLLELSARTDVLRGVPTASSAAMGELSATFLLTSILLELAVGR